ncbi:MAG: 2-hydroxyacyl-CoA dehydratase subunit D [Myxococcaceae bacterium]
MISRRLQYELAGRVVGPALMALEEVRRFARKKKKRDPGPFGPPLESGRKLKEMMTLQYLQGRYADGAVPVAWVTSGFPVEVLRALGFYVLYPENHGALCGARKMVPEISAEAERAGYSQDLCGYARTDIGSMLSGKTPVGRLPRPDLLACCTNICQSVLYWYRVLAEHFKVPLVLIDTPFIYGEAKPHQLAYVKDQLTELVQAAERVGGKRLDSGELVEVMQRSREGTTLWGQCLATGTHKPSPWTGFDGFIHMAPIVAMRGTLECNAYYRMLKDELEDRAKKGIGGIKNEKHRLLWDNLPVWYKIRELSTAFAEAGFNFVCTTYTNAWAETVDLLRPEDPLGSGAQAYTLVLLNRDLPNRLRVMKGLVQKYAAGGAVLHSDRSCKPYSIGQLDLKTRLQDEAGIKVVVLEADHSDPRAYSEEQVQNRIHAYIESFG